MVQQTDVPVSVVEQAIINILNTFLPGSGNGSLVAAQVTKVVKVGTESQAEILIQPVEAIEAITIDVIASRTLA